MPKILLIDDDPSLRKMLSIALRQRGHEVLEAIDGAAGLKLVAAGPVDLVLTDLIMPNMEGLETIMALRSSHPQLPVFAMTGGGRSSPRDYLQIARAMGARQVFAKPFEPEVVCAAIDELLKPR